MLKYLKFLIFIPFCSVLCIILNIYNGDILGINPNLEYILWLVPIFFIHFIYSIYCKTYLLINELIILLLSITINIYWIYIWPRDIKYNYRHRTEYYDSQTFIACILFISLFNNIHNILNKNEKIYVSNI